MVVDADLKRKDEIIHNLQRENQDLRYVLLSIVRAHDSRHDISLSDIDDAKKILGIEE